MYLVTCAAQRAIQATVMAQLKGIERKASSIIFFNEPLGNLNEFQYPFSFPYSALEPLAQLPNDTYVHFAVRTSVHSRVDCKPAQYISNR